MIRNRFSERIRVTAARGTGSLTKQYFKKECDVNEIMKKFRATGTITHVRSKEGLYGDFSSADDYHESMNKCLAAQNAFDALPSEMRKRFQNDPGQLIAFLMNKENLDEAVKLGLVELTEVPVVEPKTTKKSAPKGANETEKVSKKETT